ncbi:transposase, partial [Streptomyces jumonjinensis]|uniref:transposase n=1 Tax=Streptomyces jumonjinensis TaxID=1945 RepID=UPI0037B63BFF
MDFEVRKIRKAQGPKKLRREREEYFRLMQLGYSNKEACQAVGINLRTGREWRNGRTSPNRTVAPALAPRTPRSTSSRYLREDERIHIADRLREKATVRAIAAELGRSPSTVSREIRRNRTVDPRGQWHYRPHAAQARADARRPRPKPGKIGRSTALRDFIQDALDRKWSPEQICESLRRTFPDQ